MNDGDPGSNAIRAEIAKSVKALREGRRMTQVSMASHLGMSQGRYSGIERGDRSFTAEEFVGILRIFNVTVADLVDDRGDPGDHLQKALARLGAEHLVEDPRLFPSERLVEVERVVREVLVAVGQARQTTALAPVMIRNLESLNLTRLWALFKDYGLERRLAWLIDSTLEAVREILRRSPTLPRKPLIQLKKSERAFEQFLRREGPSRIRQELPAFSGTGLDSALSVDLLDGAVVSEQTLRELIERNSEVARRWGVATALQPEDFMEAIADAGVVPS